MLHYNFVNNKIWDCPILTFCGPRNVVSCAGSVWLEWANSVCYWPRCAVTKAVRQGLYGCAVGRARAVVQVRFECRDEVARHVCRLGWGTEI